MLISIRRTSQQSKDRLTAIQYLLRPIRMKSRGTTACSKQLNITAKDMMAQRRLITSFAFKGSKIKLLAIDRAVASGEMNSISPTARSEQAMKIDAGHAHQ